MVSETEAIATSPPETTSRAARRRLITRALLRNLPEDSDPRRNLFHFEQEMAEQFAKNRLSSYAVIPVLVIIMGVAIGILGDPLMAVGWVVADARRARLRDERLAPLPARGARQRQPLSSGSSASSIATSPTDSAWAVFPLLIPPSADVGDRRRHRHHPARRRHRGAVGRRAALLADSRRRRRLARCRSRSAWRSSTSSSRPSSTS